MTCIDTDILIDFLRNKPQAIQTVQKILAKQESLKTTAINVFELLKGVKKQSPEKQLRMKHFIERLTILYFDECCAQHAADILCTLKEKGESLDLADILIASIACAHNEPLLTQNTKHFSRIEKLQLETTNVT